MIEVDVETQARVGINDETIAEYVAIIREAQERGEAPPFPPVDLFFDGSQYFIGDGWHRIFAWQQTTIACIPAYVHDGGAREALLFALGANDEHGLRRTNDDKRRAVSIMLDDSEWSGWTQGKIAEACKVTQPLVSKMVKERQVTTVMTSDAAPLAKKIGRDGKKYPAAAASNGKPKAAETPEPAEEKTKGPNVRKLAEPYKKALAAILLIKKELTAASADPVAGIHLAKKIARITEPLDQARDVIHQLEPTAACGECLGEGCQHCARSGFWTRFIAKSQKLKSQKVGAE